MRGGLRTEWEMLAGETECQLSPEVHVILVPNRNATLHRDRNGAPLGALFTLSRMRRDVEGLLRSARAAGFQRRPRVCN
jgi:hypothetical protein